MPRLDNEEEGKAESKWEGKEAEKGDVKGTAGDDDDEWCLPGMGQAEDNTLLVKAAKYCNSTEFTEKMDRFVAENAAAWEDTADVRGHYNDYGCTPG